jgi:hypothetical protein
MGTAALDFLAKEWPVITGAPYHFFGGILTITALAVVIIWFLFNWAYGHRSTAKDDQLAAKEERLAQAKEKQQDAEQKSKDLQSVIEKLTVQLKTGASIEDVTVTASSAKTKVGELMIASNAVGSAIGGARVSAISSMRVEAKAIAADEERPK